MVRSSSHSWLHSALGKGGRMMGCFPCFESKADFHVENVEEGPSSISSDASRISAGREQLYPRPISVPTREIRRPQEESEVNKIAATTFTFSELAGVTNNFREDNLLGEGGFGRVYKGRLRSTGQVVAVKQLDRNGLQGNREFLVEVLMLSLLHHPNLVNLIGYCAEGDQRLLVYEFMPLGSLEDHLHDLPPDKEPLDWNTRMKIAAGAAKGLEYLHDKANPPVIYRDLKSSNILLDECFHPKLSDFGLAKLGPTGDKSHVSTRVMGTYGYCAPEYAMTGQLTVKSDVYSFGVVLLELITGRKAIDPTRGKPEQHLVQWARLFFNDRKKFSRIADPRLQGHFPFRGLHQALEVAAMCLQEDATLRPTIASVATALSFLENQKYDPTQSIRTSKEDRKSRMVGVDEGKGGKTLTKEEGRSSAIKWDLGESDKDSPKEAINHNRDLNRERAVAEAKIWGESWRDKKKMDAYVNTTNV